MQVAQMRFVKSLVGLAKKRWHKKSIKCGQQIRWNDQKLPNGSDDDDDDDDDGMILLRKVHIVP